MGPILTTHRIHRPDILIHRLEKHIIGKNLHISNLAKLEENLQKFQIANIW